ncbi:DUF551 domain-containing protein [Salmonella enterica subsp. enterica serovar Potsdam]|nr:DUF551 domain-containing protein [Salmonella enterica subsp. enterica serovar Potsdam]
MTTITKEWLQQTIAEFENTRDDIPFGLSDDDAKILIVLKRALVSLDAEPVRYLNKFSGTCVTLEQQSNAADDVAVYIPLYAAPPAPVVPEEMPAGLAGQIVGLLAHNIGDKLLAQKIWNACRTAMLNGDIFRENSISSTNNFREIAETSTNSPVILEGWISCSERMPDREYVLAGDFSGTHYLASIPNVQVGIYADWFDDEKPCWDDGDGNDLHLKEVTHWRPMPAAPKPEQS